MRHATNPRRAYTAAERLFAIGSDDDESKFVGTLAECRAQYPEFDPDSEDEGPIWFGDLRDRLGFLIDITSPDALELYRAVTGVTEATVCDVSMWLVDDASHMPHLRCALALLAHRQHRLTGEHLRQVLHEAGL